MPRKKAHPENSSGLNAWYNQNSSYIPFFPSLKLMEQIKEVKADTPRINNALAILTEAGVNMEIGYAPLSNQIYLHAYNKFLAFNKRLYIQFYGQDLWDCLAQLTLALEWGVIIVSPVLAFQRTV